MCTHYDVPAQIKGPASLTSMDTVIDVGIATTSNLATGQSIRSIILTQTNSIHSK